MTHNCKLVLIAMVALLCTSERAHAQSQPAFVPNALKDYTLYSTGGLVKFVEGRDYSRYDEFLANFETTTDFGSPGGYRQLWFDYPNRALDAGDTQWIYDLVPNTPIKFKILSRDFPPAPLRVPDVFFSNDPNTDGLEHTSFDRSCTPSCFYIAWSDRTGVPVDASPRPDAYFIVQGAVELVETDITPEPASIVLLATGLGVIAACVRSRRTTRTVH